MIVSVNIRRIAFGGDGVGEVFEQSEGGGELRGITAFVPYTVPGERVQAAVRKQGTRFLTTELTSIENPSAERVQPECRYYTICGGCELQHLSYQAQLRAKSEMIRGALLAAKLGCEVVDGMKPFVPGSPYHYRKRIHLHVAADGTIGFYRPNSRSIVAIESCVIATPGINGLLPRMADFGRQIRGKLSSILLEEDRLGVIAVLKAPYALPKGEQTAVLRAGREYFENAILTAGGVEVGGFGRQILELPLDDSLVLHVPAGSFSQVNEEINLRLIRTLRESAGERWRIFDLYAGAGNFSLPLAKAGGVVTAVEVDPRLIALGRQNAERYRLGRSLTYLERSVEQFLAAPSSDFPGDLVVADPPRSGLGSLIPRLSGAPRIFLVSCDLASFVRDLKGLIKEGFHVRSIEPFDMFAQTSYAEILSVLERS